MVYQKLIVKRSRPIRTLPVRQCRRDASAARAQSGQATATIALRACGSTAGNDSPEPTAPASSTATTGATAEPKAGEVVGAIFLIWVDALARTAFEPREIPVGVVVTASRTGAPSGQPRITALRVPAWPNVRQGRSTAPQRSRLVMSSVTSRAHDGVMDRWSRIESSGSWTAGGAARGREKDVWGVERACHIGQHRSLQAVCVTREIGPDLGSRVLSRSEPKTV